MRLFESILLLILLVIIYQLVFSKRKPEKPMQSVLFALIIIMIHVMVEGNRWQMIPAYMSFGFIYLRIKIGVLKFTQRFHKLIWGVWIVFVLVLPYLVPVIELPKPTGPYLIGTEIFHWKDSSRSEWFTPEIDDDRRELMVQVWYPASSVKGEPIPYLDNLKIRQEAIAAAGDLPSFLVGHIDLTKTHSYEDAPILNGYHPMLILSHGITGYRQIHTSLVEHLTSHGYIVVAPDHTFDCNLTVFPDGHLSDYRSDITGHPDSVRIRRQQLNTRVADIRFLIDSMLSHPKFQSVIDTMKIGVLGHSYGGATSIQVAFEDSRINAVLVLDSWMNPIPDHIIETGIDQPFLYIGRPHWNDSDYPNSPVRLTHFISSLEGESHHYILKGSRHLDFCDLPLFTPLSGFFLETGTIPAAKAVSITNSLVGSFFDHFLKKIDNGFPDDMDIHLELIKK